MAKGSKWLSLYSWKKTKAMKRSATAGKDKGLTCQTDTMKSFFAKRGRAYKHPGYAAWCRKMDGLNGITRKEV